MSANEANGTVFEAIKGGAEEYLVKPVTKKEVQNIWQYVWKRSAAHRGEVGGSTGGVGRAGGRGTGPGGGGM
jgi:ActR/RegA family two-component response regulator